MRIITPISRGTMFIHLVKLVICGSCFCLITAWVLFLFLSPKPSLGATWSEIEEWGSNGDIDKVIEGLLLLSEQGDDKARSYLNNMCSIGMLDSCVYRNDDSVPLKRPAYLEQYSNDKNFYCGGGITSEPMYSSKETRDWLGVAMLRSHNYDGAEQSFRKSSTEGDEDSQFFLGYMLYKGIGIPQDYEESEKWLLLSARSGNQNAQFWLGMFYLDVNTPYYNTDKADKCFYAAAEQGNAREQHNLGLMYLDGNGVESDIDKALEYFQLAANQGDPRAYVHISDYYYNQENYTESIRYIKLAAEKCDHVGQDYLGKDYFNGHGVEQDYVQAYIWFSAAFLMKIDTLKWDWKWTVPTLEQEIEKIVEEIPEIRYSLEVQKSFLSQEELDYANEIIQTIANRCIHDDTGFS